MFRTYEYYPDHLDRYEHTYWKYIDSKLRVFENQDEQIISFSIMMMKLYAAILAGLKTSKYLQHKRRYIRFVQFGAF
jgi:UDP-N-acetylmuramoylalanine-D-glutamate ligase